ncbi:Uma2 family endonuclease [Gloeobacter morelensis]|uniref:Uma2 family endonuclease n=1 Tax=Gloeobacter morelensis TaxID=2907343 RepID=UPI001E30FD1B|nr:Uma2 family endonuclease [Gloeobacter morelensis]
MSTVPNPPRRNTIEIANDAAAPFDPQRWLATMSGGLTAALGDSARILVASNLTWFPLADDPAVRIVPDLFVVFGRPAGSRGAYYQWQEDHIAPQVVFELVSPVESLTQAAKAFAFYDRHGVEEYYLYDPLKEDICGWLRYEKRLEVIDPLQGWLSPRLGLRFEITCEGLTLRLPGGGPIAAEAQREQERALALQQLEEERQRANLERLRAERLAEQLRTLGIDPDKL